MNLVALPAEGPAVIALVDEAGEDKTSFLVKKTLEAYGLSSLAAADVRALSAPALHQSHVEAALQKIRSAFSTMGSDALVAGDLARLAQRAELSIICYPGAPGQFICSAENEAFERPWIVWDPYKPFRYYGQTDGEGKKFVRCTMPPWLVLAHELGHYRQFVNDPEQFAAWIRDGQIRDLENDNVRTHEQPLCRAAGLVPRTDYGHMRGSQIEDRAKVGSGGFEISGSWGTADVAMAPGLRELWETFKGKIRGNMLLRQNANARLDEEIDLAHIRAAMKKHGAGWPAHVGPQYAYVLTGLPELSVGFGRDKYVCRDPFTTWLKDRSAGGMP